MKRLLILWCDLFHADAEVRNPDFGPDRRRQWVIRCRKCRVGLWITPQGNKVWFVGGAR